MNASPRTKHGIEPRFGKGRSMKLLSYAIWINGDCLVSHETTRWHRKAPAASLETMLEIERRHYPRLPII